MKKGITLLIAIIAVVSCNAQYSAGSTMTATIDGKPWKAHSVYSPTIVGKILGSYKESTISMPFWNPYKAGDKVKFSERYAVQFAPPDNPAPNHSDIWAGNVGQLEITKVSGDWMEGTFSFTATLKGSAKKIEVTNGVFHINMKNQ